MGDCRLNTQIHPFILDNKRSVERWGIAQRNLMSKHKSNKKEKYFQRYRRTSSNTTGWKHQIYLPFGVSNLNNGIIHEYKNAHLILTETGTFSPNVFLELTFKEPHFGKTHLFHVNKEINIFKLVFFPHKLSFLMLICSVRHWGCCGVLMMGTGCVQINKWLVHKILHMHTCMS